MDQSVFPISMNHLGIHWLSSWWPALLCFRSMKKLSKKGSFGSTCYIQFAWKHMQLRKREKRNHFQCMNGPGLLVREPFKIWTDMTIPLLIPQAVRGGINSLAIAGWKLHISQRTFCSYYVGFSVKGLDYTKQAFLFNINWRYHCRQQIPINVTQKKSFSLHINPREKEYSSCLQGQKVNEHIIHDGIM